MSFFQNAYNLNSENYGALCELLKLKVKAFEKNYAVKYMRGLIEENPNNENLYFNPSLRAGAGLTNARAEGINRIIGIIKNRASGFETLKALSDMIFLTVGDLDIPGQIPAQFHTI